MIPKTLLWFGPDPGPNGPCEHNNIVDSELMGRPIKMCLDCNKGFLDENL